MKKLFAILAAAVCLWGCENYQIEKNIIRNRRDTLEDLPERQLTSLPYELDPDKNFYEYGAYQDLVTWITEKELTEEEFERIFKPLFGAFFSSPWAFEQQVRHLEADGVIIPDSLRENLRRWKMYEQDIADNIVDVLDEPEEYTSRIVQTMYYLDYHSIKSLTLIKVEDMYLENGDEVMFLLGLRLGQ